MINNNCVCKCNYKCKCNYNVLTIKVTNVCNKACPYCIQTDTIHLTQPDPLIRLNKEKFTRSIVMGNSYDAINIMGGEYSTLSIEDINFIHKEVQNCSYIRKICIYTNNMTIDADGILFTRHITDFNITPNKKYIYNIVLYKNQLEVIYKFLIKNSHMVFQLQYDRISSNLLNTHDINIYKSILDLKNIRVQCYGVIKNMISKKQQHQLINVLTKKVCRGTIITTYE